MTIGKPFKKGQSGNPGGRPKVIAEVKELARAHTGEAIDTLVSIMSNPKAAPAARVSAANSLLDRGYGKPPQHITGEGGPSYVVRLPEPCKTAEEWLASLGYRPINLELRHLAISQRRPARPPAKWAEQASEEHHPHVAWPRSLLRLDRRRKPRGSAG